MAYTYEYPRPAVTADAVIFRNISGKIFVLLIERKHPPFAGCYALPGGFVDENEEVEKTIVREVKEETGLENIDLKQLKAFSKPGRDPRGHTITIAFWGLIQSENPTLHPGDDAAQAAWFPVDNLPPLAFDHNEIVQQALVTAGIYK